MKKTVKVIGVPEHFNLPWHLAIEDGMFEEAGINVVWQDIPEGTGRMREMLRNQEADVAIILTGGIIKDISNGNPSSIVQAYVQTPLLWGIHVAANSNFHELDSLQGAKAAISRFGSGSHLVSYLNAKNQGWDASKLEFEIVNDLPGAVEALTNGKADYFMWEHFTTKPLVDEGIFRRLDDCPTPWPCFVVAANNKFIKENKAALKHVLDIVNVVTADFKQIPSIDRTLANRYKQQLEDIQEWLSITEWSQQNLSEATVANIQKELKAVGIIDASMPYNQLIHPDFV